MAVTASEVGCKSIMTLPATVIALVERQARKRPWREAIVWNGGQMTYGELNERANRMGNWLKEKGVERGERVGVLLERSGELVAALLGTMKSGGSYVGLDKFYPRERLKYMMKDAGCRWVITEKKLRGVLDGEGVGLLVLEEAELEGQGKESPGLDLEERDLAYVIYTSGSTGRPKGVEIEHGSVGALLQWVGEEFSKEELGGMLASTSVCFDLSVFEIFGPLSCGGRVILAGNVLQFSELENKEDVRLINTVPSAMRKLLLMGGLGGRVRTVCLAGEVFPARLARELWRQGGVRRVLNLYGPTEDTTYSSWAELEKERDEEPPIGRTLPGTEGYVLDMGMELCAQGVAGELYLGGRGLARGYMGKAAETGERFVPNPFSEQAGQRLYRTGDRVRRRGDGVLEYVGRLDEQVKISGYRVELGEVEKVMEEEEGIEESVVVAKEGEGGERRLVGYYTGHAKEEGLRNALRKRLPEWMVPDVMVWLEVMPCTANGKRDRKHLPEVDWTHGRINEARGQRQKETVPFSIYQEQIWFREQLHPARSLANWIIVFQSKGLIPTQVVKKAFDEMTQKHEVLRAAFKLENCRLIQTIEPSVEILIEESDLTEDLDDEGMGRRLLHEALHSFDLTHPPLLRAKLIRRSHRDAFLLITLNPIIIDAFSLRSFGRELLACCQRVQAQAQPSPSAQDFRVRYTDFAISQPNAVYRRTTQKTRWEETAGLRIELPVDRPCALASGYAEASHEFVVPPQVANQLNADGPNQMCTLCVLLAAYYVLLSRYSGHNDLVIGVAGNRRFTPIPEGLIGCFEGVLPLALRIKPEMLVGELLEELWQKLCEAYECSHTHLSEVGQPWNKTLNCSFSFTRTDRHGSSAAAISADSDLTWRINALPKAPCDLALALMERFGEVQGVCYFRSDLFEKGTIERMLRRYLVILEKMVFCRDLPVGQLPIGLPEDSTTWRGNTDKSSALEQPPVAASAMELGSLAAARFVGLTKESRLVLFATDGKDLYDLGKAAATVFGAELFIAATEEEVGLRLPTHVLVSPETLAKLRKVFHVGETTLILYGLPCFSGALARYQEFPFLGLWGISQVSSCLATLKMKHGEAVISSVVNGFRLEVLDGQGKQQVPDVWGELHIGVGSLVREVDLAVEKDNKQLWHSGLIARYRSDRTIAVRGFKNRMLDLNGTAIDPEWLTSLLRQHPAIEQVRVKVQTQAEHQYLVAWIIPTAGRRVGEKELLRYVVKHLGFAYRPDRIVITESLPTDDTAVVVLPDHIPCPPRTVVEAAIARIWRDVLKNPQSDVHNSFFDQGSSLTAVEMVNRMRDSLHVNIDLPRLFESPTIASLAKFAESDCMTEKTSQETFDLTAGSISRGCMTG